MSTSENNRNFDVVKIKHELQNLILGNGGEEQEDLIQTTARYLRRSKTAGTAAQEVEHTKEQETKSLIYFIDDNALWYTHDIKEDHKIGEGAEQKVYYDPASGTVIKINDSIYFLFWLDYFYNLILHNYFFSAIKYTLHGFIIRDNTLCAVVEQPFVKATAHIDLDNVKGFLKQNGFENTKNNDYRHKSSVSS